MYLKNREVPNMYYHRFMFTNRAITRGQSVYEFIFEFLFSFDFTTKFLFFGFINKDDILVKEIEIRFQKIIGHIVSKAR